MQGKHEYFKTLIAPQLTSACVAEGCPSRQVLPLLIVATIVVLAFCASFSLGQNSKLIFNVGFITSNKQSSYAQAALAGFNFMTQYANFTTRPTARDYQRNETVLIYSPSPTVEIQYNLLVEYSNSNATLSAQLANSLYQVSFLTICRF